MHNGTEKSCFRAIVRSSNHGKLLGNHFQYVKVCDRVSSASVNHLLHLGFDCEMGFLDKANDVCSIFIGCTFIDRDKTKRVETAVSWVMNILMSDSDSGI